MHPWLVRYIVPTDVPLIGGQDLSIPSLMFLATVGFMLALGVVIREADRHKVEPRPLLDLSILFLGTALVGGRLGHALLADPRLYRDDPSAFFDVWRGGMDLFGALILSVAAAALFCRRRGLSLPRTLDVFAPALSFGLIFGRLGALGAGSGYGRPIDFPVGIEWPWGVAFYSGQVPDVLRGVALHPVQLYLALGDLALFLLLRRVAARSPAPGKVAATWAVAYGLMRLALDTFRFDLARVVGPLSLTQLLGLALAVAGAVVLVRLPEAAAGGPAPGGPAPAPGRA